MSFRLTRHYCTYFDREYLSRAVAMHASLQRWSETPFQLWILCLDDETWDLVGRLQLAGVHRIRLADFERADPELAVTKSSRSRLAYYWSCTPALLLYVLGIDPSVDLVTYVDADLLFFSSPEPVFRELGGGSLLLIPHRWSHHRDLEPIVGTFNVQMLAVRKDEAGLTAARWWRARCLEWCATTAEAGRFGDQKYLDDWPTRFSNVVVLQNTAAGLGPWNAGQYALTVQDGQPWVDGVPAVFFHYHGFAQLSDALAIPNVHGYRIQPECIPIFYAPYMAALREANARIRRIAPGFEGGYSAVSLRRLARAIEARALFVSWRQLLTGAAWRQLVTRLAWPRVSRVLALGPSAFGRWLARRRHRTLRECASSRQ